MNELFDGKYSVFFAMDNYEQRYAVIKLNNKEAFLDFRILGTWDKNKKLWLWGSAMKLIDSKIIADIKHDKKHDTEFVDDIDTFLKSIKMKNYIGFIKHQHDNFIDILLIKSVSKWRNQA